MSARPGVPTGRAKSQASGPRSGPRATTSSGAAQSVAPYSGRGVPGSENSATASLTGRAAAVTAAWGPTAARVLLGLVLAWFGYHELVQPALWTGYVPVVSSHSTLATVLVLAHGWILLVLAVALVAGIMPRVAAGAAAILLLEIVISLTATGGLSDLTLRDVGVLGLAIAVASLAEQRLVLKG